MDPNGLSDPYCKVKLIPGKVPKILIYTIGYSEKSNLFVASIVYQCGELTQTIKTADQNEKRQKKKKLWIQFGMKLLKFLLAQQISTSASWWAFGTGTGGGILYHIIYMTIIFTIFFQFFFSLFSNLLANIFGIFIIMMNLHQNYEIMFVYLVS